MKNLNYSKATDVKWQERWKETKLYKFDETKVENKFYLLEMFSYPSGKNLHIGHWWNYGLSDSYGRFKRMQGYQLFHPPGFDAFGLPAENYAIKTGVHPSDSTKKNVSVMEEQFSAMGTTYDWDYEIVTCNEEYYMWTQWLFLKLYEKGLAYRKNAPVNWCPTCMTVLANEQAADGKCERCESAVITKSMTQWFFKITDYAEELLSSLDTLDWPEKTKLIQKNWIGKSSIENDTEKETEKETETKAEKETKTKIEKETVTETETETVRYRLHDWLVSRQRYWGTPIPIIYCDSCGIVPVPEDELPVRLPYNIDFELNGQSPLASCAKFTDVCCPICKKMAKRDTDTLDTFVCSSWYYLRFFDNKNRKVPFDKEKAARFMPVDKYVGGIEHASMHLLYARFITKVLRDMGYVNFDEPFPSLFHQGIIFGEDGKKMSKRDGAISPDAYIEQYGSDVFRMYLGFGFSYVDGGKWDDDGIKAIARFAKRVSNIVESFKTFKSKDINPIYVNDDLEYVLHHTIKQVAGDYESFRFNSAIARIMEYVNAISDYQKSKERNWVYEEMFIKNLLVLLAPLAPHLTEEAWEYIGCPYSIHNQRFPVYDEAKLIRKTIDIAVQVNGHFRDVITVSRDMDEDGIKSAALISDKVQLSIGEKKIVKVIYVKDKIMNIICKG